MRGMRENSWTVTYVSGGDKGEDVVIAPNKVEAINRWIKIRKDNQFFLHAERTPLAA